MKELTNSEKIQIHLAAIEGGKLLESERMTGVRTRAAESREKQKRGMVRNLEKLRRQVLKKIEKRRGRYEVILKENGNATGTLADIFKAEGRIQEQLAGLESEWNSQDRTANPENFSFLRNVERVVRQVFMPDSGYMEEATG